MIEAVDSVHVVWGVCKMGRLERLRAGGEVEKNGKGFHPEYTNAPRLWKVMDKVGNLPGKLGGRVRDKQILCMKI